MFNNKKFGNLNTYSNTYSLPVSTQNDFKGSKLVKVAIVRNTAYKQTKQDIAICSKATS